MAIIQCKECGNSISDKAEHCIHCGCPISENKAPFPEESGSVAQKDIPAAKNTKKCEAKPVKGNNRFVLIMCILAVIVVVLAIILIRPLGKDTSKTKNDEYYKEKSAGMTNIFQNEDLPTAIEYRFIDYTDFSQYWFDGVFRCGTDFISGDYYILPLFGAGAMYDVSGSPNDWSWSNYRCLRKISAQEGDYVNVAHGAIMVPAEEVDTDNWQKYGVYLVGRDILEGEYKMETITDTYCTDLYNIEGVSGAYQICDNNIENNPVDSNYLFESQKYVTLENGQYISITNIRLTNIDVQNSEQETEQENKTAFSMDAKPVDGKEYQHDDFVYIIYDDDSIEITKYLGEDDSVTISKEINGYAVSRIGESAFEDCSFIEDIYLYADIISVGDNAFKNCTSLEDFTLPDGLVSVGVSAFEGCTAMTDVYVYGCQTIGDCAFKNCTSLEDFTLPDELVSVGVSAFEGCTSLEDVYVYSDDVTYGVNSFANCPKLEEMPEGAYNDYSKLESSKEKTENVISNNDVEETFILNSCFAYTPRSFMERLDKADKELDGYNYTYMRANGEENLYYELADIEGGYEHVESVGMVAFDDSTGSPLSIDDDFTENSIGSITILVEDIDDVPALLVCSMCAADPSLDFMTAYNIGDNVIEKAETADGYTYNCVNYVITENGEYYFIIISVDTSENTSADKKRTSVETTEYELNFADFCVPNTFEHTETDGNVMWFQKGENNRMMVKIEKIPDYMKIDTGSGSAITSTKDVVDFYTYDYEDDTISEEWVKLGKQDCYEKVFSVDTDTGVRKGRSIVIPINGNEGAISVLALCEDDELLSAVDIIIESINY